QEVVPRPAEAMGSDKAGQRAREARGRQTRLERMERLTPPAPDQQIRIQLKATPTSQLIFQSDGLRIGYGDRQLLQAPAFTVGAGERIAVVGPNGSGKTSLLRVLMNQLRPLQGRVRAGPRVSMRYYDQHLADLDPDTTVVQELQDASGLPEQPLRTFLGRLP